jgi:hypothetical protein
MIVDQTKIEVTTLISVCPGPQPMWKDLCDHLARGTNEEMMQMGWEEADGVRMPLVVGKSILGHRPKAVEGPSMTSRFIRCPMEWCGAKRTR